ncbi:hypothetical protein M1446_00635 [Candidatus Dependentiae bacterium]|nr:hypothetical protein [Candidatus Dependentiae bacterium]
MKKIIFILILFLMTLSSPEKTVLGLMPLPLWNLVADHLNPNDKALIYFIAPNLGLTNNQADRIVNFILSSTLKKTETIEELIHSLRQCTAFKTSQQTSNARKIITEKLKTKIKQLSLIYNKIRTREFSQLNDFFYQKKVKQKITYNYLKNKKNINKLALLKKEISSDLLILCLIINELENTEDALQRTFKLKNDGILILCLYLIFEFCLFSVTEMGADMNQCQINYIRIIIYTIILSLYLLPEKIYSVPFNNNYLFLNCVLNGEDYSPESSINELSKKFEPIKKLYKHIKYLLSLNYKLDQTLKNA